MRMPPNPPGAGVTLTEVAASMRGGMRMPPNPRQPVPGPDPGHGFNEGRHAHAAEYE